MKYLSFSQTKLGSNDLLCVHVRAGQAQHLFSWRRISQSEIQNSVGDGKIGIGKRGRAKIPSPQPFPPRPRFGPDGICTNVSWRTAIYFSISKSNSSINSKKYFLKNSLYSESLQISLISLLSISVLIFSNFSFLTLFTIDRHCSSV